MNTRTSQLLLLIAMLGLLFVPGCFRFKGSYTAIEGSGVAKTEARTVGDFSQIEVGNAMQLQVHLGEKTAVEVTGDDNLVPLVQTKVAGDKLEISFDGSYSSKIGIVIKVTAPKLTGLSASGASTITATDLKGSQLTLKLSGASSGTVMGKVDALGVECSGASKLLGKELAAKSAKVNTSGASQAEVNVSDQLEATASGASSVRYTGNPKKVLPNATGASNVKELSP